MRAGGDPPARHDGYADQRLALPEAGQYGAAPSPPLFLALPTGSAMMSSLFDRLKADGVPADIPWLITEYGYSAFGGEPLVQMPSALLRADALGDFLGRGVSVSSFMAPRRTGP